MSKLWIIKGQSGRPSIRDHTDQNTYFLNDTFFKALVI